MSVADPAGGSPAPLVDAEPRTFELRGNLGVYLDRPSIQIPAGGLSDARNCRLQNGKIVRDSMGWSHFFDLVLNGPVTLIDTFTLRDGTILTVFGTHKDLYAFDLSTGSVSYITPKYATGVVLATQGSPNLVGGSSAWIANAKAGDEIHVGSATETDPDAIWYTIQTVVDNAHITLTSNYLEATAIADPYTIRKKFTGTRADVWSSIVYYDAAASGKDYWYATNGIDFPVRWDPDAASATYLTALAFTCKFLASFSGMMIYGNLTASGDVKSNVFRTSAIGDPENVSTLEAIETNGVDISDHLVAALPIGDNLAMYGHRSFSVCQFVGPPLMWVIRTLSRNRGILSRRGVVDQGDFHEIACIDGAYQFDGVRTTEFAPQVFRAVVNTLDLTRLEQVLAFVDRENGEVLWVVPSTNDGADPATAAPVRAYVEHFNEPGSPAAPPMMIRDMPAMSLGYYFRSDPVRFADMAESFDSYDSSWDSRYFAEEFPVKLMGMQDGTIMELGFGDSQDGVAFDSYARFRRIALSEGIARGLVREVEAVVTEVPGATYSLKLNHFTSERAEGTLTLAATVDADLTGTGIRWKRPRVLARFLELEARVTGLAVPFGLSGVRLKTRDGGTR